MTTQTEKRYLQKLGRWRDGTLSHHWITLEILSTHNRMVTYTLVGSMGTPITEPLRVLLDREYRPVATGELPEQFKAGVYAEEVEDGRRKEKKREQNKQDNDFDKWLASNYSPAGEDASNGEQWFLSNSPHEFMPVSLSKLMEQYNLDDEIEEDEVEETETFSYTVPVWCLSPLIKGNWSGLKKDETEALDIFVEKESAILDKEGWWNYDSENESYSSEPYFSHSNDVTNLSDLVVDIEWVVRK